MIAAKTSMIIALAGLFACVARAGEVSRPACIQQSASYLEQVYISTPVRSTLVAKLREFYPDVSVLIEDEVPSQQYSDAMAKLGNQAGCQVIVDHFRNLPAEVACYETLSLEEDEMSTLDIIKSSDKTKQVVEAYYACVAAIDE